MRDNPPLTVLRPTFVTRRNGVATRRTVCLVLLGIVCATAASSPPLRYDIVIRHGTIYDGKGAAPYIGDLAIAGDSIAAIGDVGDGRAGTEIEARGLAVAPGFINMLSWANETLLQDGRSQSDIRQGVTLEVFGEGWSMGPLTDEMKKTMVNEEGDIRYPVTWTTLAEYLDQLARRGISTNVASFVGATTVRMYVLGSENRAPTRVELDTMRALVQRAMEDGALGVGSSLIYAPAFYAQTDELVALCTVASRYGGIYISHIRSEGNTLLEALDELITIARQAHIPAELYHLKAAGQANWHKLDSAMAKIEKARQEGLSITADMYTYTAGATALYAAMPPWVQEGGFEQWRNRLRDPATRKRLQVEMSTPTEAWENLYLAAGSAERVLLSAFKTDSLKYLTGKTLAEVASMRHTSPEETMMDLVIQDDSPVGAIYFIISEDNLRKQLRLPWVSFGSDEGSMSPDGVFLKSNPHPRAYGNVARLLGKYVRDERVLTLQEAIRRLTFLPATTLSLKRRGALIRGNFADVVVFDPLTIRDHATYDNPHQYATGVRHVFVNGIPVVRDGEHTGALPGRVIRGPGWTGSQKSN